MSGAKKGARDLSGFNYGAMSSLVVNQGEYKRVYFSVATAGLEDDGIR